MINFKLENIDNINSFGSEGDQSMHWFALTNGEYWIEIQNVTLFEYTNEIRHYWGDTERYASYQIFRFIMDFTALFPSITESIPSDLFEKVKSAKLLGEIGNQMRIMASPDNEMAIEESYWWIRNRTLFSEYFTGAPEITFFRCNEKIKIIWIANQVVDNRIPIWTAQTGEAEMDFEDFIVKIEDFGKKFLIEMEKQVNSALERDWGDIIIDKTKLKECQIEMVGNFDYWIKILRQGVLYQKLRDSGAFPETNWQRVRESIDKLNNNSPNNG